MKILFVLENYYPNIGGVETLFKNLTEQLVKKGFEITVVTNRFSKDLAKQETINNVKIIRLPFYNRYLFTFLAFFPLLKYAKENQLIHTTSYNAAFPAYLCGLLTSTPVIVTFHEVWSKLWFRLPYMNKLSASLHYLFEWLLLKLNFYKWIAVSDYTNGSLVDAGVSEDKVITIHNGIEYAAFEKVGHKERNDNPIFKFIYFGRLGISKGLDILLPAVKLLSQERDDFIITMVIPKTPTGFYKRIIQTIENLNIEKHIEVRSHLPWEVLKKTISQSNAALVPSYSEGFCFSAVEAMAMGVPVISSNKGALAEVISGKHLIMENHDAQSLADCMDKALNDKWNQTPKRKYPLHDSIEKYISLYNQIKL